MEEPRKEELYYFALKDKNEQLKRGRIHSEEKKIQLREARIQMKEDAMKKEKWEGDEIKFKNIREEQEKIIGEERDRIERRRRMLKKYKDIKWYEECESHARASESGLNTSTDGQLERYVNDRYSKASIDYSDPTITKHIGEIEAFVDKITDALGDKYPVLRVRKRSNRGSMYNQTKVYPPDEVDFVLIPDISYDKSKVKVEDTSKSYNTNSGIVSITDQDIVDKLNGVKNGRPITFKKGDNIRRKDFVKLLVYATKECISQWENVWTVEEHGPAVCVLARMPLCWVSIDLCFCFEESKTERGRHVLVPIEPSITSGDRTRFREDRWTLSVCDIPPDSTRVQLNELHRKLLVVLKSIFQTGSQFLLQCHTPSSHILITFVETHQMKCVEKQGMQNIVKCFREVIEDIMNIAKSALNRKLPDIDFRRVNGGSSRQVNVVTSWSRTFIKNVISTCLQKHLLNDIKDWKMESKAHSVSVQEATREVSNQ
ncbi:unnamed protein product [Owenia fusiformis]|uniref:Uncharacterized protein n=1 Tax=Owenia fusiformis TaxID=6347 RepID=A0A8J1UTY7_OWEFU|nr:unnamed protein product [Owenia fusiformis]